MLTDTQRDQIRPIVRTMQIIVGALVLGVTNFLAVVIVVPLDRQNGPQNQFLLTYLAVGSAAIAIVAYVLAPSILTGALRQAFIADPQAAEVRPIAQIYQTLLIIRCAILEGAAFFCLVSYMLERQPITLAATSVLVLVLLAQFPTLSRESAWIENEMVVAEQFRHLR
jgi:hypothetical protein